MAITTGPSPAAMCTARFSLVKCVHYVILLKQVMGKGAERLEVKGYKLWATN